MKNLVLSFVFIANFANLVWATHTTSHHSQYPKIEMHWGTPGWALSMVESGMPGYMWYPFGGVTNGLNGDVESITVDDNGNLWAAGFFTAATDVSADNAAYFDGSQWVDAVKPYDFPARKVISVGSEVYMAAQRVFRWAGSFWQNVGGSFNGVIYDLAEVGGEIYAVGLFSTAGGGVPAANIAKWDGTQWAEVGGGTNSTVNTIETDGTDIYIGGYFTSAGGTTVNRVAKWDGVSWDDLGGGTNQGVFAIEIDGSDVYVGGQFTSVGSTMPASKIAKWDGSNWSPLGVGLDGSVADLVMDNSILYAAGSIGEAGSMSSPNIMQWNGSGWSAVGTGVNRRVNEIYKDGSDFYIGGDFYFSDDKTVYHVAKWSGSGWEPVGASTGLGTVGSIRCLDVSDAGDVYAGGLVSAAQGKELNGLGRWDGQNWHDVGGGVTYSGTSSGTVQCIETDGNLVYVGGLFNRAGNVVANNIARWDGTAWSTFGLGTNGAIDDIAVNGSDVYVAGRFTEIGGVSYGYIARWDGNSWHSLGSGCNGTVGEIEWSGGNLYAAGTFTAAGGVAADRVARWNGSSWSAMGSGFNSTVTALTMHNGTLYAGGFFTQSGPFIFLDRIAKWNGFAWGPLSLFDTGLDNWPSDIVGDNAGNIYVTGSFTSAGGSPSNHFAKWNGNSWETFPVGLNGLSSAACIDLDGRIYVGGYFSEADGQLSSHIVEYSDQCPNILFVDDTPILPDTYQANTIISTEATATSGNIIFSANCIDLQPGFEVTPNMVFETMNTGCN